MGALKTGGNAMKSSRLFCLLVLFVLGLGWSLSWAQFPQNATYSTLVATEFQVEGLTGDNAGNLFTAGRQTANGSPCPVYRVNIAAGAASLVTVGFIPDPDGITGVLCNPAGIAFNSAGDLFVADSGAAAKVYTFPAGTLSTTTPPTGAVYTTGVPGANGIAFDRNDNLWVSDGTTNQGRVWKVAPCATLPCAAAEIFRIQPMRNTATLGGDIADNVTINGVVVANAVGRQNRTFPPGTLANSLGGQDLVANGLAFNQSGHLFVADTARGAIWRVQFDRQGNLKSPTNCDTTFTANTLCLSNIFIAHPLLEGTDGIALDRAGNIWNSVNERNAMVVVTNSKSDPRVIEVFRNPANSAGFRNSADPTTAPVAEDSNILEFPNSPYLTGKILCTSNSDGDRRDNSPNVGGEVKPGASPRGKISCMDQDAVIQGLPLPIH
jgi:sugar lactone lactonase YvrE